MDRKVALSEALSRFEVWATFLDTAHHHPLNALGQSSTLSPLSPVLQHLLRRSITSRGESGSSEAIKQHKDRDSMAELRDSAEGPSAATSSRS